MDVKRTIVIAGLLGLGALLTGCGLGGTLKQDKASYDVADKVAGLQVEADSGTVEVVGSDRQGIHVTESLSWRGERPAASHDVQGDTLTLKFTCPPSLAGSNCEVSYQVEVPRGLRVKATTDSGKVTLKTLSGDVEAQSDSGAIDASGLTSKQGVAATDSGDITLVFTDAPDKVETSTDSGRSVVHVPQGPYNIVTRTDSGGKKVTATHDPSSQRSISLISDSGDLEAVTP
ncbi:DUF4097 family beta strand repeat-containing protein [Nonomuraea sp. NPDC005983]|uniref:DUF4097 family beta strand repeat-containing protein n=1 Tax=Nonomuraea sp. NPDC005983 TaxID=3155595 RepID=UPI0033ACF2C6